MLVSKYDRHIRFLWNSFKIENMLWWSSPRLNFKITLIALVANLNYLCRNRLSVLRITDKHVVTNFVFYHSSHVKFLRVSLTAYLLK